MTKLRRLGYNLAKLQGKQDASLETVKDAVIGRVSLVDDSAEAVRFLESLRKDNLARVIAEPSLATLSGCKAVFHSGGKIPLPKPEGRDGSTPIDWEEYGTQAELTPSVLGNHRLRLSVYFRVAELDNVHVTHLGNETVPGLRTRDFHTVVEMHDGQTFAFTGLNQVHVETSESGVPIASSIPYIGSAFKNVKEERNETAMFVLVRPEIVQPADAADNVPATVRQPGDYDVQR